MNHYRNELVSVIIPTYNRALKCKIAVESVLTQVVSRIFRTFVTSNHVNLVDWNTQSPGGNRAPGARFSKLSPILFL